MASDSLLGSPRHDVTAPRFRLALERGDCVAARRLLAAAKVNGGDAVLANRSYGTDTGAKMETPLHGAARTGNVLLVQLLLEHHADARARDGTGATPAHVAICVEVNQRVGRTSLSHFSAMTRPSWFGRAVRNRHRHAIEPASRRWRSERAVTI